ncbi:MAG: ubiquinol-cytochrome c reductase iron-sulfur subunit [Alphaproteobacteria bacterium]|nr:ubiquinol-cytochrome c reductase iron-sulfur subunit [Alphaproteobacteria bacterium]MBP7758373.1 ubiquinol-cytochrome c reductase iron-sulfur subunit [Alphaproteobacteria bacterium]MBP7762368.1 ubiquinol-cytochrome c reductase iron-sulfur subunit [Alphaproteobacteria bacterium]MBP7903891.1 ubiquinol-cytochrome c reductase iron-sulfur subunit [Alphaproteobacteria bacterium]
MSAHTHPDEGPDDETRRDFMALLAGAFGALGAAIAAFPLVNSLNPAKDTLAMASIEVDIADIPPGAAKTVMWRGKPVFIRHRTPEQIEAAKNVNTQSLIDKQTDEQRVKKPEWLVTVGVCTHLGCVPMGQKESDSKGDFGGWFCPCHGSHYDTSGRIRKGPAPKNLTVPPYEFLSDTKIKIG